ncbi:MAG: putative selenate reductase subunit YgfK [Spirochaetia bacterium]
MGDKMRLLPFEELLSRIFEEYRAQGSVFDLSERAWYRKPDNRSVRISGEHCETALGPAAGPHTQLAPNIVSSYLTGSRFIELKTVQILDALELDKPCIDAADEGYNTEWSTELSLEEAWREYAKGWILLHLLEEVFDLRATDHPRSFVFNMSVGYDLAGIRREPMQRYIARMRDSSEEPEFAGWLETVRTLVPGMLRRTGFEHKAEAVAQLEVSPRICRSVTLSTMHGCPPEEIEAICNHMLRDWGLDTYVKLNPTLIGYEAVRNVLTRLGYDYVELDRSGFERDLQYDKALEILGRLRQSAHENFRRFGVKLTNTLPSVNTLGRLPGEEYFLSGRALFPLSIALAARLSRDFDGRLPVSYSGGINAHNVEAVFRTGIRPITMATDLLKPGGYQRQKQMAEILDGVAEWDRPTVDVAALNALAEGVFEDETLHKAFRGADQVRSPGDMPVFDCYEAPCVTACAIGQHVPEYIRLAGEERWDEALELIYERNALPSMTGHICDHQCQLVCTRLDYEGCVNIREIKRLAVMQGAAWYAARREVPGPWRGEHVAVVGAGPAGLSAAYFLSREGFAVTVFEREADAGGIVRYVVPQFRISREAIESDVEHIRKQGVRFRFGADERIDVERLKAEGFDFVVLGVGTYGTKPLPLDGENDRVYPAFPFLRQFNDSPGTLDLGRQVVVVGAGDTAMDCARAALRAPGVEQVSVVYRRSEAQMPASREEYELALRDGVEFLWLRNPARFDADGTLELTVMELGEVDHSGRRRPVATDRTETIHADSIVHAVGERPDAQFLAEAGLEADETTGRVATGAAGETELENVFLIGDSRTGPSTIVSCIAEGRRAADRICRTVDPAWRREERIPPMDAARREAEILAKKGTVTDRPDPAAEPDPAVGFEPAALAATEKSRCLECDFICNKCVDVCPNRANIAVPVSGETLFADPFEIVHLDAYCNECGNCGHFCPWDEKLPYVDKPTVFSTAADFENSSNPGWLLEGQRVRLRFGGEERRMSEAELETAARGPGDEARFARLFAILRGTRPHLFGPVEPEIPGVPR